MAATGVTVTTPSLSGIGSYLILPALTNTHHELRLDVEFKPLEPNGILLFSGGKSGPVEDFVSLAMVDGHLEFRYELGSGKHWVPCVGESGCQALHYFGVTIWLGGKRGYDQEPDLLSEVCSCMLLGDFKAAPHHKLLIRDSSNL